MKFFIWLTTWATATISILIIAANYESQTQENLLISIVGILFIRWLVARLWRKSWLMKRYGDKEVVKSIMRREIWIGASKQMIKDSWGSPGDIKQGSHQSTWCYKNIGKNRWQHRINFRNGRVTSFTEK